MKTKVLLASILLLSLASPAIASTQQKTAVVSEMFEDARINNEFEYGSNSIISLYKYATKPFRHAIKSAYNQANTEYGELTLCGETLYNYHLQEGGAYDMTEIDDLDIKLLSNGRVRAVAYVSGMSRLAIREYAVTCHGNQCLISDAYDRDGGSAVASLGEYCY